MVSREDVASILVDHMRGALELDELEILALDAEADGKYEPEYAAAITQILELVGVVLAGSRPVDEGEFHLALASIGVLFCPKCGRVAWRPKDLEEGYCVVCHAVTGTPYAGKTA